MYFHGHYKQTTTIMMLSWEHLNKFIMEKVDRNTENGQRIFLISKFVSS